MADEYASREPRGSASSIRLNRSVQRLGWMPIRSIATSTVRMTKMARVIRNAVSAETSSGLEEKLDWSRNGGSPGEKTGGAVIDLDLFDNEEGVLWVVMRAISATAPLWARDGWPVVDHDDHNRAFYFIGTVATLSAVLILWDERNR